MKVEGLDVDEPVPDPWEVIANTIHGELEERGQQRQRRANLRIGIREWVDLVPEERGPLDLERYAFQIEPCYSEHAVHDAQQVTMKSTQSGLSTGMIRQALYQADVLSRSVLYTFPTDDELRDFSRKRIKPVIRASPHLRSRMTGDHVDNVGQKQIGQGWISFRGLQKPVDSIDVDVLIIDEYDTSDEANITATEYRLSGAESAALIRRVGVPSVPGSGIDRFYQASDQRLWTVRCDGCNHWNRLRGFEAFSQNVDQVAVALVCAECRRPIDVRTGEWTATFADRSVRGYHVPKLLVPGRRVLAGVIERSKKTRPDEVEAFHRRDLGEAWAPAEGRLSLEAVRACVRPDLRLVTPPAPTYAWRWMGVDMASSRALNVVIEETLDPADPNAAGRQIFCGAIDDIPGGNTAFQQLCWLMDSFGVNMCGIDNSPDGRFSETFADRYPGRVYRVAFFSPGPDGRKDAPPWYPDDAIHFVSVNRTTTYDATFERFRLQKILLPPLDYLPPEYPAHLGNLYRRSVELPGGLGRTRVDYVKTGPEDYAQAEAYKLTAIELFWRNSGLNAVRGQGPVPMADQIEDLHPVELADYTAEPDYRPGFE